METTNGKSNYMLLFRGTDWDKGLSPEEIQKVTGEFMAWFQRLLAEGKARHGHPLLNEGKVISGKNGRTVADGPFAESKEAVGGYVLLQNVDEAEALSIARRWPALEYGLVIELREVATECPIFTRNKEQYSLATA